MYKKINNFLKQKISGVEQQAKNIDHIFKESGYYMSIRDSFYKRKNIWLKPSQMFAATQMAFKPGKIIQMDTGEGKTYALASAAILKSLNGEKTFIVTINDFLAQTALEDVLEIFNDFNIKATAYNYKTDFKSFNNIINENSIIYTTHASLAATLLAEDIALDSTEMTFFEKDWHLLLDEIDVILIEDNNTPFALQRISHFDEDLYTKSFILTKDFIYGADADFFGDTNNAYLTEQGIKKAETFFNISNLFEGENLHIYNALIDFCNALMVKELKAYTILNNKVIPIDPETGKTKEGSEIKNGIKQAVEIIENIPITPSVQTTGKIAFSALVENFASYTGASGSSEYFNETFSLLYGKNILKITKDSKSNTFFRNDLITNSTTSQFEEVFNITKEAIEVGRAVIIGAANISIAQDLELFLQKHSISCINIANKSNEDVVSILKNAGLQKQVTIIEPSSGRGINIRNSEEVEISGGMFFIGVGRNIMSHLDLQMQSRVGRLGDKAEIVWVLSPNDPLFNNKINISSQKRLLSLNLDNGEKASSFFVNKIIATAQRAAKDFVSAQTHSVYLEFQLRDAIRKSIKAKRKEVLENFITTESTIEYIRNLKADFLKDKTDSDVAEIFKNENILNIKSLQEKVDARFNAWIQTIGLESFCAMVKEYVCLELDNNYVVLLDEMDILSSGKWLQALHSNKNSDLEFRKNMIYLHNDFLTTFSSSIFEKIVKSFKI